MHEKSVPYSSDSQNDGKFAHEKQSKPINLVIHEHQEKAKQKELIKEIIHEHQEKVKEK